MRVPLSQPGIAAALLGILVCHSAPALTYEELRALIQSKQLTTIEQTIAALPMEYRFNYALLRASRSLQSASPIFPRVILFGHDAKLLLAYNGEARQAGYDTLETIQFRDESKSFDFHRITFPADSGHPGDVQFSEKNPALCLGCHTNHPRPNWDQYNFWKGAYGETDDFPRGTEITLLGNFFLESLPYGRYQFLIRRPGPDVSPYEIKDRGRLRYRPNFRLSAMTFAHQAEALLSLLQQHPAYPKFRFLFALSRLGCQQVTLDWRAELTKLFGAKAAAPLGPWPTPNLANLYAFVARAAGVNDGEWKTSFLPTLQPSEDPYFFHCGVPLRNANGIFTLADAVLSKMIQGMIPELPALQPHYQHYRWVEYRFRDQPEDRPYASALDDALDLFDSAALADACPILARAYDSASS